MARHRCLICDEEVKRGDWVMEVVLKDQVEHGFIHDAHLRGSEHEEAAKYLPRMIKAGQYGYPASWPEGT